MKIFIFTGDQFGERILRNLVNDNQFCIGCAMACDHCRDALYGHYGSAIWGFEDAPQGLPEFIEDPKPFLPKGVRGADLFIAIGIHPDLLVALPDFLHDEGVKALIVPVENPRWCSPGLENTLREAGKQAHVEIAVPRPFCALEKGTEEDPTPTIDEFMETFHVGQPEFYLTIEANRITGGRVIRTEPCGAAYYILKQITGETIQNDGSSLNEKISKAHHSYPCSASMDQDKALCDTPLHMGGYILRNAVLKAIQQHFARKRSLEAAIEKKGKQLEQ
jgi:hypothetical protein